MYYQRLCNYLMNTMPNYLFVYKGNIVAYFLFIIIIYIMHTVYIFVYTILIGVLVYVR